MLVVPGGIRRRCARRAAILANVSAVKGLRLHMITSNKEMYVLYGSYQKLNIEGMFSIFLLDDRY